MPSRRRTLLVNKRFQLKFCLIMASWPLIFGLVVVMHLISRPSEQATLAEFYHFQSAHFGLTIFMTFSLSLSAFVCALLYSQQMAGPINRVEKALKRWRRGHVEPQIRLRKNDAFMDLAGAYNEAAQEYTALRNQMRVTCSSLESLAKELEPAHRAQVREWVGELRCCIEKES